MKKLVARTSLAFTQTDVEVVISSAVQQRFTAYSSEGPPGLQQRCPDTASLSILHSLVIGIQLQKGILHCQHRLMVFSELVLASG